MNARRWLAVMGLLLAMAGCSDNPTKPVPETPLSLLVLSPQADTLFTGDQHTFVITALDTAGTPVPNPTVHWFSSNQAVFTVSPAPGTATVTAVGEGTAQLIASSGGLADTSLVLVVSSQTGWVLQISNTTFQLNDVFFQPDGNTGWVVGESGRILKSVNAGKTWATQISNSSFSLNGVWFTSATEGWAVGASGTVLHTTNGGSNWARMSNVASSSNLFDVTFTTPDSGWIVGSNGAIIRTVDRGLTWEKQFPTSFALRGVAVNSAGDGWAVGDAGTIIGTHDAGVTWFIVVPGVTSSNLHSVRFRDATFANAAGDGGSTPRTVTDPDSVSWEIPNAGAQYQFEGLWYANALTGWAVGYNGVGAIVRTDDGGAMWTQQISNTQFRLKAVYFIDAFRGWAVGTGGVVLHTSSGGFE